MEEVLKLEHQLLEQQSVVKDQERIVKSFEKDHKELLKILNIERKKRDDLISDKYFQLKYDNVNEGSLKFTETDVFFYETRDLSSAPYGTYYMVNYKKGIIQSKMIPSGTGTITYSYSDFPFKIESTDGVITAFADKDSQKFLFTQKEKERYTDPRDKEESSQPKSEMVEYIYELLSNSRQTWGT